jgi:hypothetical protein
MPIVVSLRWKTLLSNLVISRRRVKSGNVVRRFPIDRETTKELADLVVKIHYRSLTTFFTQLK